MKSVPSPVLETQSGKVQGEVVDGIHRFLGIPYAEPPFAERRWLPPVPRSKWSGVRPVTEYGAICPQTGGIEFGLPDEGEDCLNLNIWTPDPTNQNLPVMVWAHGGGQVSGAGSADLYDGWHFANEGVVLVTCNRRLGAEGYLYLEELFGDGIGAGNLGIQDLISVLTWVNQNIAAFGGNPNNVTLFGESGGGAATQATIATPGSSGLVHKVIIQSGGHSAQRTKTATDIATHVVNKLGKANDLEGLRQVPFQQFEDLYPDLQAEAAFNQPQVYLPVISDHMPNHPVDAAAVGMGGDVDYLIGTCRDEANLFSALLPEMKGSIFHKRADKVIAAAGVTFEEVAASYRIGRPTLDEDELFTAILGDMWFRLPSIKIAEDHQRQARAKTYMYLFEWESPLIGAAHALDIMVFGNGIPFSPLAGFADYETTANYMRRAWINFASSGSPSGDKKKMQPDWPEYSSSGDSARATMSLNHEPRLLRDPYQAQRTLLQAAIDANWHQSGL